jgi:hypothetical protein
MRKVIAGLLVSLTLVGCSKGVADGTDGPSPQTTGVARQADIYAALMGGGQEFGDMRIVDQVCADAGEPVDYKGCSPMSAELKAALLERLPSARFISDPLPLQERLMEKGGVTIHWVGPIVGSGSKVEVGTGYWCGGLCGSGGTKVVEFRNGAWVVTGSVGGTWIS